MDFSDGHFPDYRPGYTDYNTMRDLLWKESAKITDFAFRKDLKFNPYNVSEFKHWNGYDIDVAMQYEMINIDKHKDVYIASATIPEKLDDSPI
jgi:hypothetical protein